MLSERGWTRLDGQKERERERRREEGREKAPMREPIKKESVPRHSLLASRNSVAGTSRPPPPQPSDKACLFHNAVCVCMPQFNDPSHWPLFLECSLLWPPSLLSSWSHFISHNYSSGWLLGSQNAEVTLLIAVNSFKSLLTFNYECLQLSCQGVTFCCRRKQAQEAEKE